MESIYIQEKGDNSFEEEVKEEFVKTYQQEEEVKEDLIEGNNQILAENQNVINNVVINKSKKKKVSKRAKAKKKMKKKVKKDIYLRKLQRKKIDISKSHGAKAVLQIIIDEWKLQKSMMYDQDISFLYGYQPSYDDCVTNKLPGLKFLCEKSPTSYVFEKYRNLGKESVWFWPKSFCLPHDRRKLQQRMKKSGNKEVFIFKPSDSCGGSGIKLINKIKDIPDLNGHPDTVVQEYIKNPQLINQKKFDFRVYVLIQSLDPFVVFIAKENMGRFCIENYKVPKTAKDLKNIYSQLTNYSLSKFHKDFQMNSENDGFNHKQTMSQVFQLLKQQGHDTEQIWDDIKLLTKNVLEAYYPFIFHFSKLEQGKRKKQLQHFHILGIDIILDKNNKPWLLEVNQNPSLSIKHEKDEAFQKTSKEIHISETDLQLKKPVVADALKLAMVKPRKAMTFEEFGSYENVHVEQDLDYPYDVFLKIEYIFRKIQGVRVALMMSSQRFIKLAAMPGMTTRYFKKYDYDILYMQIENTSIYNQMDIFGLCQAFEVLSVRLYEKQETAKGKSVNIENMVNLIEVVYDCLQNK